MKADVLADVLAHVLAASYASASFVVAFSWPLIQAAHLTFYSPHTNPELSPLLSFSRSTHNKKKEKRAVLEAPRRVGAPLCLPRHRRSRSALRNRRVPSQAAEEALPIIAAALATRDMRPLSVFSTRS